MPCRTKPTFTSTANRFGWNRRHDSNVGKAYRVADAVRAAGVPVVMGGPHVTEGPGERSAGMCAGFYNAKSVASSPLFGRLFRRFIRLYCIGRRLSSPKIVRTGCFTQARYS